jgi:hypothetical protein
MCNFIFDWFFSGNQTTTSSTLSIASSSFSTTTTTISLLSSSIQVTIVILNEQFDKVQRQNNHQMFDRIKTSTKLFSILFVLYILVVLFKWKNIPRGNSFIILLISLLLFVAIIVCVTVLI